MLPMLFDENPPIKQDPSDLTSFKMENEAFMNVKIEIDDFDEHSFLSQSAFANQTDLLKELSDPYVEKTLMEFVEGLSTLENLGVDLNLENLGSLLNTPPSSPDHEPENLNRVIPGTSDFPCELSQVEPIDIISGESVWSWDFTQNFLETMSNPVMLDDAWMGPQNSNKLPQISPSPSNETSYTIPIRTRNSVSCSSSDSNDSELNVVSNSVFLSPFPTVSPTPSVESVDVQSPVNTRTCNSNVKVSVNSSYYGPLSDHSYHDVRGSKNDWLGVQTPSDSEDDDDDDDVDVVALPVKRSNLPQIPTSQAQRHIQKQMAMAAAKKGGQTVRRRQFRPQVSSKQRVRGEYAPSVTIKHGGLNGGSRNQEKKNSSARRKGRYSRGSSVSADKREDHNSNERERRSDLRNLYLQLNNMLPAEEVGSKQRSKANILLGAISEINMLKNIGETHLNTKKALDAKRRRLVQLVEFHQRTVPKQYSVKNIVTWVPPKRG